MAGWMAWIVRLVSLTVGMAFTSSHVQVTEFSVKYRQIRALIGSFGDIEALSIFLPREGLKPDRF